MNWNNLLHNLCPKCGSPIVQNHPVKPDWYMCVRQLTNHCDFAQTAEVHEKNLISLQGKQLQQEQGLEEFKRKYHIPDDYPEKQLALPAPKPEEPPMVIEFTTAQLDHIAKTFLQYCISAGVVYDYDIGTGGYNHKKGRVPDSTEFMDYITQVHPKSTW